MGLREGGAPKREYQGSLSIAKNKAFSERTKQHQLMPTTFEKLQKPSVEPGLFSSVLLEVALGFSSCSEPTSLGYPCGLGLGGDASAR